MDLNLLFSDYLSSWGCSTLKAHSYELLSSVHHVVQDNIILMVKETVSCKCSKPSSHPVGSTWGANGVNREWGSLILYVKYWLLSELIDTWPLYFVSCHRSRSSFLTWHMNMFCMATKFLIASTKFRTLKPIIVMDCHRYFAILCLSDIAIVQHLTQGDNCSSEVTVVQVTQEECLHNK